MAVTGIILAGGNSRRFGGDTPKQFQMLGGKRVLEYSVLSFTRNPQINDIIIVVPENWLPIIQKEFTEALVVPGGQSRKASSLRGLQACSDKTTKVLIHDAARMFVDADIIQRCLDALENSAAVATIWPVKDTIAEVESDQLLQIPERSRLFAQQTPQGFDYQTILKAHRTSSGPATDDIQLVLKLGYPCTTVPGSELNYKITTRLDLKIAAGLLNDPEVVRIFDWYQDKD
ncbi:MAG: 2-C-methyl-D-erythritol 4-phosphate cytidylyltransferase [FCB group bacterium]|nr:2-C-methyl-D-erythritol 4-phosphate cytidylyltransferase [FCB group bacterium]